MGTRKTIEMSVQRTMQDLWNMPGNVKTGCMEASFALTTGYARLKVVAPSPIRLTIRGGTGV